MIEKISTKLLDFVGSNMTIDSELAEIYKYGIEISISTALNILLTMIIAFALGDPLCGIVFLGCMILIRSYCGGYHADSYFKCNCMMIILFSVAYGIGKTLFYFEIAELHIMSSVLMLGFIPIYAFSPVKNKHKELSEKKAKKCRKISFVLYIAMSSIGLYLISLNSLYGSIIIVTLVEVSVAILIEIYRQRRIDNETQGNGC